MLRNMPWTVCSLKSAGLGNLKGLFSSATFDLLQSNTNNLAFGKVASFWENRQSTVFPNPLSVFKTKLLLQKSSALMLTTSK